MPTPEIDRETFTIESMLVNVDGTYRISNRLARLYLEVNHDELDPNIEHAFHYILDAHFGCQETFDLCMARIFLDNYTGDYIPQFGAGYLPYDAVSTSNKFIDLLTTAFIPPYYNPQIYDSEEKYCGWAGFKSIKQMIAFKNKSFYKSELKPDRTNSGIVDPINNILYSCEFVANGSNFLSKQQLIHRGINTNVNPGELSALELDVQGDYLEYFTQRIHLLARYCSKEYFDKLREDLLNKLKAILPNAPQPDKEITYDKLLDLQIDLQHPFKLDTISKFIALLEQLDPLSAQFDALVPHSDSYSTNLLDKPKS